MCIRDSPEIVCRGELSKEEKAGLYKRIIGLLLFKISGICRNSFDSIVLSAFLGLIILTKYQNYFCILTAVVGILAIVHDSITAGIGNSIAAESIEKNYRDFNGLAGDEGRIADVFGVGLVDDEEDVGRTRADPVGLSTFSVNFF